MYRSGYPSGGDAFPRRRLDGGPSDGAGDAADFGIRISQPSASRLTSMSKALTTVGKFTRRATLGVRLLRSACARRNVAEQA